MDISRLLYSPTDRPGNEILNNFLWLGTLYNADESEDESFWPENSAFTHILNMCFDISNRDNEDRRFGRIKPTAIEMNKEPMAVTWTTPRGIKKMSLPLEDDGSSPILEFLPTALDFIALAEKEKGKILVHCMGGINRSVVTVLAYLIRDRGYSLENAVRLVTSKRPCVCPHYKYRRLLAEFEKQIRGENSNIGSWLRLGPIEILTN